jgi:ornithine cyclodeaminase
VADRGAEDVRGGKRPEARFRFLSQEDVIAAGGLEMGPTIDAVEEALRLHAIGEAILPHKTSIRWGDDLDSDETRGRIMAMAAYLGGSMRVAGLKWIPSVPDNASRGLPRGIGITVLTDRDTGLPLAVMDCTLLSAMRTGAVTGVACRALGAPGTAVATILGAGVQARTQLMALRETLALEEVRIWDIAPERARAFCEREADGRHALVPTEDPEGSSASAHVVVAATMAPAPFVGPAWLGPGGLFVSISSLDPTLELVAAADVLVCDVWEHETEHPSRPLARALAAGIVTRERVAELGEILVGTRPGRTAPEQRVLVSPVGLGIEDVAVAYRAFRRAEELGLGTELELWKEPRWT